MQSIECSRRASARCNISTSPTTYLFSPTCCWMWWNVAPGRCSSRTLDALHSSVRCWSCNTRQCCSLLLVVAKHQRSTTIYIITGDTHAHTCKQIPLGLRKRVCILTNLQLWLHRLHDGAIIISTVCINLIKRCPIRPNYSKLQEWQIRRFVACFAPLILPVWRG